ncbi:subtilase family protein [Striga asiatica]|uniref:Subtilase family protein n=1 Tax=Striga asiatica TaxID=4170 RepID=A0A5A7PCC5_STRAF|nr:subtilase family protein [Striga asiatica]
MVAENYSLAKVIGNNLRLHETPSTYGQTSNNTTVRGVVGRKINCRKSKYNGVPEAQLNIPSFTVHLGYNGQEYSRTVTNVGDAKSTYRVEIESVPGVNVTVKPTDRLPGFSDGTLFEFRYLSTWS